MVGKGFFKCPLKHFTSGPLDYFDNYIELFDLKNSLIQEVRNQPLQDKGVNCLLNEARMLLKRFNEKAIFKGDAYRDYDIWFEISRYQDIYESELKMTNLRMLIKEDNNGTMHLFTFEDLQLKENEYGELTYSFSHEFGDEWTLVTTKD